MTTGSHRPRGQRLRGPRHVQPGPSRHRPFVPVQRSQDEILDLQAGWLLGLENMPSAQTLKSAYRTAIKRSHPDKFAADDALAQAAAVERAKMIIGAYERLSGRVASTRA